MKMLLAIKIKPRSKALAKFGPRAKKEKVNVVVFKHPPLPFCENVILTSAPVVHADADSMFFECAGKDPAGELSALIVH